MKWLVVLVVSACHTHPAAVKGATLGYVTPTRVAAWVIACGVPLKRRETALTLEVACNERSDETPSWRVSIYYKDGAVSSASFSARTLPGLEADMAHRADAVFGVDLGPLLTRSVAESASLPAGSGISVARTSLPGGGRVASLEEIRWTASIGEK